MKKRTRYGILRTVLSLVLAFSIISGNVLSAHAAASAPAYNCKKTKSNVLRLLDAYDSDGAYIIRSDKGDDLMLWFYGYNYLGDRMDTAVHETFHSISVGYDGDRMYIGGKKSVYVPRTQVFSSTKASQTIPKRLQTFRFETYMTNKKSNIMHSVINGPYGLLNEMSAYSWGMNNSIKLYPYFKENNKLSPFYISCSNNKNAYAEFTFFILYYLNYAKNHDKKVYNGIMKNAQFKKVYKNTDKRFKSYIQKYDKIAKADKYSAYYPKASSGDYTLLMKEISKSKYQKIYRQLTK